ncbi:MAG: MarR family winged helix-turn-helix transcriptional regulator, partial [Candidatus Limnocylindrales bacterium]
MANRDDLSSGFPAADRSLVARMRLLNLEGSFYLQAVAERLGMGATDLTCLTVLLTEGPAAAGSLAARTGLTSGAITGVVDRLERSGWVRRISDPADRRRVIIEALVEHAAALRPVFDPLLEEATAIHARFSERDRATIGRYVEASIDLLADQVRRLRADGG